MPYIGRSTDGFGVRNRFLYLASASDTSVSGADANGAILSFSDGAYVDVYLNGVLLKAGTDYNTNTANTIAGLSALAANDEVTVIVYDIFAVADTVSQSSGGTFSGAITFSSTVSGLDVNGTEVILDADGDTTITADTDDQIDIKIAGADDFQFTANTFTAQSGSTIAAQALTATTITTSSTIDINGNELILDADADTSITADTDDRIDFKVANSDIIHMLSTGMGIGTNNPAHTLDLKASAPEIMLEETSSGGSKRLSLGVKSDGTPFINAEQSGGIIDINLSGAHTHRFTASQFISQHDDGSAEVKINASYSSGSGTPQLTMYRAGTLYGMLEAGVNSAANGLGDHFVLFAAQGEVYAKDSAGNSTLLSPHNFDYIPDGVSETGAWAYKSDNFISDVEKDEEGEKISEKIKSGTFISADMTKVIRQVEKLTGEKLIYKGTLDVAEDGKVSKHIDDGSKVTENIVDTLTKKIETLEAKVKALEEA